MRPFLTAKRPKSTGSDAKTRRPLRLLSSIFSPRKLPRVPADASESPSSLSDKLDASPVTPSERSATHLLHTVTPATHHVLAAALERLSDSDGSCGEVDADADAYADANVGADIDINADATMDASPSQRRRFFFASHKTAQPARQSYSQLRVRSDLLAAENDGLKKRLSQLEMARVERDCLHSRVTELEWALDVLRDDADRVRDDALALVGHGFQQSSFCHRARTDVAPHNLDRLVDEDIDDLHPDDILFDTAPR